MQLAFQPKGSLPAMKRTDEFAKDLCKELNRHRKNGITWECAGPAVPRKGHESVDATGYRKKKPAVLVEIELRHQTPLANVVKAWKRIKHKELPRNLILIQAFSANYPKKDTRRLNAEFVGQHLTETGTAKYVSMQFKYKARKYGRVGAGRRRYHATLLAKRIVRLISRTS